MRFVVHVVHAVLHIAWSGWVILEISAGQFAVPGPVVLGIGSGVYTYIASTRLNVALERILLQRIQHITSSIEKYNGSVSAQVLFVEHGSIFSGIDDKAVFSAEFGDCIFADADGGMPENGRFAEYEHPVLCK